MKFKSLFLRKFFSQKITVFALLILVLLVFTAVFGPYFCKYDPLKPDMAVRYETATKDHLLGTDYMGRDTFTRLVYGARYSLITSFLGCIGGLVIGTFLGLIAGYYGGFADTLVSRAVELFMAMPGILMAVLIVAITGRGTFNTGVAIAFSVIASFTRITRSMVMSIKNSDYVKSCYIIGESDMRIIFTHILPNSASLLIVTFTLNLGTALLLVSSLSFIGIGVPPPYPEWGSMIGSAKDSMRYYPLGIIAPGACITLFVIGASLVGDALRDALDPKSRV